MTDSSLGLCIELAMLFGILALALAGTIHSIRNPKHKSNNDDGSSYYVG